MPASADEPNGGRITVSGDRLRAELAEMELRLRVYFDAQFQHKADKADLTAVLNQVRGIDARVEKHERGEFSDAQRQAILHLADSLAERRVTHAWTSRERVMAVTSALVAMCMFALSLILAFHGGGL